MPDNQEGRGCVLFSLAVTVGTIAGCIQTAIIARAGDSSIPFSSYATPPPPRPPPPPGPPPPPKIPLEFGPGTLFKRCHVDRTEWKAASDAIIKIAKLPKLAPTAIECGSICVKQAGCKGFRKLKRACELLNEKVYDLLTTKGANTVPLHVGTDGLSVENKARRMKSKVAVTYSTQEGDRPASNAVDGNSTTLFTSKGDDKHPVLLLHLPEPLWIQGVLIHGKHGSKKSAFLEVRVGNSEFDPTLAGDSDNRTCKNQLCYRTGETLESPKVALCPQPIKAKYVSIEKYDTQDDEDLRLEIYEVQLVLFKDINVCNVPPFNPVCPVSFNYSKAILLNMDDWKVTSSSELPGHPPHLIADTFPFYTEREKVFISKRDNFYPWIQIELPARVTIVAMEVISPPSSLGQHLEVRVADEDVSQVQTNGERFCHAPVCHITGISNAASKVFDCSTTLTGRYVTIQKYLTDIEGNWQLGVAEVMIYHLRNNDKK